MITHADILKVFTSKIDCLIVLITLFFIYSGTIYMIKDIFMKG